MKRLADGAELNVLHGARGVLSDPRLRSMLVELNAGGEAAVEGFLAGHGLHRAETYREGDGEKRPSYARFERS